jgi:hypothetical protein
VPIPVRVFVLGPPATTDVTPVDISSLRINLFPTSVTKENIPLGEMAIMKGS